VQEEFDGGRTLLLYRKRRVMLQMIFMSWVVFIKMGIGFEAMDYCRIDHPSKQDPCASFP
jgi:hypothetical protein